MGVLEIAVVVLLTVIAALLAIIAVPVWFALSALKQGMEGSEYSLNRKRRDHEGRVAPLTPQNPVPYSLRKPGIDSAS
jgi:hypothetical protein